MGFFVFLDFFCLVVDNNGMQIKKSSRGRPSSITKVDMEHLQMLAKAGWDDVHMAQFCKVTPRTFDNWKKQNPDFFRSLKSWKLEADEKVERSLYERACGYSCPEEKIFQFEGGVVRAQTVRHYPPDPVSCIFWLKNRQPEQWREKQEVKTTSDITVTVNVAALEDRMQCLPSLS